MKKICMVFALCAAATAAMAGNAPAPGVSPAVVTPPAATIEVPQDDTPPPGEAQTGVFAGCSTSSPGLPLMALAALYYLVRRRRAASGVSVAG